MKKPIATRISQWNSGTEVLYRCPICHASFAIYGAKEKFCHNCGEQLDWGVLVRVNNLTAKQYHNAELAVQTSMIEKINEENNRLATVAGGKPQEMIDGYILGGYTDGNNI